MGKFNWWNDWFISRGTFWNVAWFFATDARHEGTNAILHSRAPSTHASMMLLPRELFMQLGGFDEAFSGFVRVPERRIEPIRSHAQKKTSVSVPEVCT